MINDTEPQGCYEHEDYEESCVACNFETAHYLLVQMDDLNFDIYWKDYLELAEYLKSEHKRLTKFYSELRK